MTKHRKLQMRAFCFGALNRGALLVRGERKQRIAAVLQAAETDGIGKHELFACFPSTPVSIKITQKAQTTISRLRFLVRITGVEPARSPTGT